MVIGVTAPEDDVVTTEAAGGTGRLAAGCGVVEPDLPNVVPVDEAAGLADRVDAGAKGCAAIEPDAKLTGAAGAGVGVAAGAGACAVELNVESDAPAVDGAVAGTAVDAGVDSRESEP